MGFKFVLLRLHALAYFACVAAICPYKLVDSYNHTNFFDKFHFIESNFTTGNYNDVDPTSGYVNYRNRADAQSLGLMATQGTEMFLGVNHRDILDPKGKGRDSVRIESNQLYNHGLFIAEFTHMPERLCGLWPAYWTYGAPWPTYGELDMYENWNLADNSMITLHTGNATEVGNCTINQVDMLDPVTATNCDVTHQDENQSLNQACNTQELLGQWGSKSGGVYAMEWTSESIKVWSWSRLLTPVDIRIGMPDPALWGLPHFAAGGPSCDIDSHVANQKLVLNIDFCGVAAGSSTNWNQGCRDLTGYDTCIEYVANNPDAFANAFWKVKGIDVYERERCGRNETTMSLNGKRHSARHLGPRRDHH